MRLFSYITQCLSDLRKEAVEKNLVEKEEFSSWQNVCNKEEN